MADLIMESVVLFFITTLFVASLLVPVAVVVYLAALVLFSDLSDDEH